ncbi:MAG: TRAP transporter large permease, partial [Succinatimonas sp.]|nr:TRAP transporter large permease [Succinatimonas sp.]
MLLLLIFICFISIGLPIAFSFGVAGIIYILSFTHFQPQLITTVSFSQLDSFSLMAVPFFIFAGDIMRYGGVSSRLIKFTKSLLKKSTSAVGTITIVASAFFGAISGAAVATVAAIGGIMIPEMRKTGYKQEYSAALASAAGYLGILIPPSIPLLVFGVTSNQSIGDLFIAGIIPGLLACSAMVFLNIWLHKRWMNPDTNAVIEKKPEISIWIGFKEALPGLLMPIIILGGIYGGIFTATEAAAVAIVYGLIVSVFIYKEIKIKQILSIAIESAQTSAKILFIIALAGFFGRLMTMIHLPAEITNAMLSISSNKYVLLGLIAILFLFLGMVMETSCAILIVTPILMPLALQVGINPIHLGIIIVFDLDIGIITPPMAVNIFVGSQISNVPVANMIKPIIPFVLVSMIMLIFIIYIQQISL